MNPKNQRKPNDYEIIRRVALIHNEDGQQMRLNVISWNGEPARYDLRIWRGAFPGGWHPGKGVIFSAEEANQICAALLGDLVYNGGEGAQNAQEGLLPDQTENPAGND